MAKINNYDPALSVPEEERSYFDGSFWGLLGHSILVGFVTLITFGIAFPWMFCYFQKWKAKHTVICGKRMYFDGTGIQLIGKYLLWSLLSVITFGIYGLWMAIAIKKWLTKHTHYVGEKDNNSYFDGGIGGYIGINILWFVLTFFTLGIGKAWADKKKIEWNKKHTVIDSRRHIFIGTGGNLFGKYLLWGFLSAITFGIFSLWIPIKLEKWEAKYTVDNEHTTDALIKRSEYRAAVQAQAANHHTQRVQDEMELVKSGVTDATDKDALFAIAQSGNRAAQFEYVTRYSEENYTEEPFLSFLKNSAAQSYPPAMSVCGLANLADSENIKMVSLAAQNGQIASAIRLMRVSAQNGLSTQNDTEALPFLEESVRWYDTLKAGGEQLSIEDTATNEKCQMAIRRIKAKAPIRKTGAGAVIGIIALILAALVAVALIVGVIALYFNRADMSVSVGNNEFGSSAMLGDNGYNDESMYGQQVAGSNNAYYEEEAEEEIVLSNMTYDDFMARLRANLEGDPNYYVITFIDTTDSMEHYSLTCNKWYWKSYFDLYVKQQNGMVTYIELDGPRVYEEIDENINGQEFQFLLKRMYEVLGLGEDGEAGGVFIKIDPGTNGMQPFEGWDYTHNHTEDRLNTVITPN